MTRTGQGEVSDASMRAHGASRVCVTDQHHDAAHGTSHGMRMRSGGRGAAKRGEIAARSRRDRGEIAARSRTGAVGGDRLAVNREQHIAILQDPKARGIWPDLGDHHTALFTFHRSGKQPQLRARGLEGEAMGTTTARTRTARPGRFGDERLLQGPTASIPQREKLRRGQDASRNARLCDPGKTPHAMRGIGG